MKRPIGISILAFVFIWLTIAGLGNAWVIIEGKNSGLPVILGYIALIYGLTTLVASVGLWMMKIWGLYAVRTWMILCGIFFIGFMAVFNRSFFGGILTSIGFLVFIGIIFGFLNSYVTSKLIPDSPLEKEEVS